MLSLEATKDILVKKLIKNNLPTFDEFVASLSVQEKTAFINQFYDDSGRASSFVQTRIRQLAEQKARAFVDTELADGTVTVTQLRVILDN